MSISKTAELYRQRSKLWFNNAKWNYQAFYSIYRSRGVRKLVIPIGITWSVDLKEWYNLINTEQYQHWFITLSYRIRKKRNSWDDIVENTSWLCPLRTSEKWRHPFSTEHQLYFWTHRNLWARIHVIFKNTITFSGYSPSSHLQTDLKSFPRSDFGFMYISSARLVSC